MMNVLFNCSTNIVGGGLKNSALFIKFAIDDPSINWHFAVSEPVYKLLQKWDLNLSRNRFTIFKDSPARNKVARNKLVQLSKAVKADLVYTMAGPAYVSFPCKHVMGISNPYITHADWEAYKLKGSWLQALRYFAYTFIQFLYTYKADFYVFQTQYAKQSFHKRSFIKNKKLFVVPNAYDNTLRDYFRENRESIEKENDTIKIFCPGASYVHKGLQFIPGIISELIKLTPKKFKFILTLPKDSELWKQIENELQQKKLEDYCTNVGSYIYTELVSLLEDCDMVFVPSLLETFSASYLEAMCAGKKLIVAKKSFAEDICQDYAVYTNPTNFKESASKISKVFDDLKLSKSEIDLSNLILDQYGNQETRYYKLSGLIKTLSK